MYKIYGVCASGIGTSLFARKLISESIKELGYDLNGITVSCIGAAEAKGMPADLLVTGDTIAKGIPHKEGRDVVEVVNMINDKEGMKKALAPVLEKAAEAGKIKKV